MAPCLTTASAWGEDTFSFFFDAGGEVDRLYCEDFSLALDCSVAC